MDAIPDSEIRRATQAATVAELAWLGADRSPCARPAIPLWLAGQPVVAYPYAYEGVARELAAASAVVLAYSDPRMNGSGWQPMALRGRPRLVEDRSGDIFTDQLLEQELRKYPPARALADSPLLRREHWWYLPRLLVLVEVDSTTTVRAREDGTGQVLTVATDEGLDVDTVSTDPRPAGGVRVSSLAGRAVPDGPAALLGHDFSVPDLERWTPWLTRGRLLDGVVHVDEHPERAALEPVPGIWQRFRRHRQLEKACRGALAS